MDHALTLPDPQASPEPPPAVLEDVTVIIPALNEAASLPLVLKALPAVGRVIVVDNGSTDGTPAVARQHGAWVVTANRRGYGSACLRGLQEISKHIARRGRPPRVVVFLDADYSDHAELLPTLVQPIFDGNADFVLGSRLLGVREPGAMPPQAVFGNHLACFLMRRIWGAHYTDLGPFRAIDYAALCRLGMEDPNFGWTVEMQIKAALHGLRTMEVPVPYRRRVGQSKISGTVSGTIKAGYKILLTITKYAWKTRRSRSTTPTPRVNDDLR